MRPVTVDLNQLPHATLLALENDMRERTCSLENAILRYLEDHFADECSFCYDRAIAHVCADPACLAQFELIKAATKGKAK